MDLAGRLGKIGEVGEVEMSTRRIPAEVGVAGLIAYVWWWDSNGTKRESISSFFWKIPRFVSGFIWGYVFCHLVFKIPRRILIRW